MIKQGFKPKTISKALAATLGHLDPYLFIHSSICSLNNYLASPRAYLVAQTVKNPFAMWEIWVHSLGWEDSPGGGHGDPFQFTCLENPHGQRSMAGYSAWGHKKLDTTEQLSPMFQALGIE